MTRTSKIILVTLFAFAFHRILDDFFFYGAYEALADILKVKWIAFLLAYIGVGLPVFLGVLLIHPVKAFFSSLGMNKGFPQAMLSSFICTLPMLIGYATVFNFDPTITLNKIMTSAVAAALFEELYFRGFLFGQIYRFTKFGFIPAVIIGAILFGMIHLYQSNDPQTIVGIFFATFFGALLFAWSYVEWQNNLWVPIGLHFFMNLFWMLFSAGDNAFGGTYSNIFRLLTIALIIIGTIVYKKRNGLPLELSRHTLWMKK